MQENSKDYEYCIKVALNNAKTRIKVLDKSNKKNISFAKKKTENELTQKSFVESFLSSIRTKIYGNK